MCTILCYRFCGWQCKKEDEEKPFERLSRFSCSRNYSLNEKFAKRKRTRSTSSSSEERNSKRNEGSSSGFPSSESEIVRVVEKVGASRHGDHRREFLIDVPLDFSISPERIRQCLEENFLRENKKNESTSKVKLFLSRKGKKRSWKSICFSEFDFESSFLSERFCGDSAAHRNQNWTWRIFRLTKKKNSNRKFFSLIKNFDFIFFEILRSKTRKENKSKPLFNLFYFK